jgi:glycosyltransferase involved in cell wall biosynthesis
VRLAYKSVGSGAPGRSARLDELPPPPKGRSGWPWDATAPSPTSIKDLPLISVVTPSFNQGRFLEETIRSVLLQSYPNLEYFVMDGGSTDESLAILKKYEPWLTGWESKPDRGQPHAINKGIERSSGSLLALINSDDLLMPGALLAAGAAHIHSPHSLIAGDVLDFRESDILRQVHQSGLEFETFIRIWRQPQWHQPGIFIPRELFAKLGTFDESQQFGFDYEFMCRALESTNVLFLDIPVAMFRLHELSKTGSDDALIEREHIHTARTFWHKFGASDRASYKRYKAEQLFRAGCSRLIHGRKHGVQLILEGFGAHPLWAIAYAARQAPRWIRARSGRPPVSC